MSPTPNQPPRRPAAPRSVRTPTPRRRRRVGARSVGACAAVVALVALAACGGSSTSTPTGPGGARLRTLRIALDYTANVDYLGIYVAIDRGYFTAEGIKADIIPYSGTPAETLLSTGRTDLALTYPPNIPAYRATGLKYRAVAGLSQENTIAIAVLASSRYTNVAQLNGTLYGGFGVASDKPIIEAVLKRAGVADPSYKTVVLNADAYQALAAKRVAYSIVYGGIDDLTAELQGVKLRTFPIRDYLGAAFSFPDDAYVATDKEITSDPGLLRRGLAALARGYGYSAAHPAAAEAILVQDNHSALSQSVNIVTATGNATARTFLTPSGAWGPTRDADFAGLTRILVDGGLIKAADAPAPSDDFTNSLLPSGS
jgi:ABC-type nitrate/sulfonate/bicarbonate transport system substrate-binding protein